MRNVKLFAFVSVAALLAIFAISDTMSSLFISDQSIGFRLCSTNSGKHITSAT